MDTISMFDVIPITGMPNNGSRFCLVCSLGSAPVMVSFVQPAVIDTPGLLEALQTLSDEHKLLQVVVVCLSAPTDTLVEKLREIAELKKLKIPLTVLPDGELPASLPVNRLAENTVLLYRGRRIYKQFENVDLTTFDLIKLNLFRRAAPAEAKLGASDDRTLLSLVPDLADTQLGKVYGELDGAAADLVSGL